MSKDISSYKYTYFLGIGGIGMSSICRYLMSINIEIFGYDKTETSLTQSLVKEGANISYVLIRVFIPLQQIAPLVAISVNSELAAEGPANLKIRRAFFICQNHQDNKKH